MSKRMKFRPARRVPAPKQSFALASRNEKVLELPSPITSESDKKLYKVIQLENGLRALLISDPTPPSRSTEVESESESSSESAESGSSDDESSASSNVSVDSDRPPTKSADLDEEKHAACTLTVGVGSYSDPPEIQGLAHFVEHMVFMGSKKYPKENEFDSFIKKKGGYDNAQTEVESTSFQVEIPDKYLLQTLDRFSQFFVEPLMKKDAMQREREAIESEFSLGLPGNENRKDQFLASLFPPGHPARTFTWGNLKSLRDMVADDELHKAAHEFRARHYSAHRMTVAVQARLSLETLERYVVDTFGQIANNNLPPDDFSAFNYSQQLVTPQFASAYLLKPVGDVNELQLTWILPSLQSHYESKPEDYIAFLLGHEGKGSLLSYLKKKVWALGIKSGNSGDGIDDTSMYSLFTTQIVLTQEGIDNVDSVLEAVFSYINLMRKLGPNKRIFEEMKSIEDMNFRFEEEEQPIEYVEELAVQMQYYPPQHYITGAKIYYKYDPEMIQQLMDLMTPESTNILILSNKHSKPVIYDQKEAWFGTEYTKMDIPPEWMIRWKEAKPINDYHMPLENQYITTDFSLIDPASEYQDVAKKIDVDLFKTTSKELFKLEGQKDVSVHLKHGGYEANVSNFRLDSPSLLRKNDLMEVWYKPDFKFRMPTALLYFYFITPLSLESAKAACLLDLWTDVLRQSLIEPLYPADMASLSYGLYMGDRGFQLKIFGYSQKLHLLVDVITTEMRSCCDQLTEALFEAVKDVRKRVYKNTLLKPDKLNKDIRMEILITQYISLRSKAQHIDNVTLTDLKEFSNKLLNQLYMQVLVQGNLPWYEALRISSNVQRNLAYQKLQKDTPRLVVREIPKGVHTIRVESLNVDSANSVITNYYQVGPTNHKDTAIIEILMLLMEEPLFDRLRTKEQLGYSIFNLLRYTLGILGYSITANSQADKFTASHVDGRIEAFLKRFSRDIAKLTEKSLNSTRDALVQLKHAADVELREEADRNWREISSEEYVFRRPYVEAEALQRVTLSEVKSWLLRHTRTGDRSDWRKLSVQVEGHKNGSKPASGSESNDYGLKYLGALQDSGDSKEHSEFFITNIEEFKNNLKVYPLSGVQLLYC